MRRPTLLAIAILLLAMPAPAQLLKKVREEAAGKLASADVLKGPHPISVCNNENKNYYLLKGTVSIDHNTIKGVYQNEAVDSDKGTFTLEKL